MMRRSSRFARVAAMFIAGLARVALLVLALALAALLALVCVISSPPVELIRRAAVAGARDALGLAQLDLDALRISFRPRGRLELEGLQLGAPRGYELPLLTLERLVVAWDLRQLSDRLIRIERVEIVRPLVRVEERDGKPSWQALLDQLSRGQTLPEAPSPARSVSSETRAASPPVRLELQQLELRGLGAFVAQGARRLALDAIGLRGSFRYGSGGGSGKLVLSLAPGATSREGASVGVAQDGPAAMHALLGGGLRLVVDVQRLQPLRARTEIALDLTPREIRPPPQVSVALRRALTALPPARLALRAAGQYGQPGRDRHTGRPSEARFALEHLTLKLDDRDLLSSSALLSRLDTRDPWLSLEVAHLSLPLDRLGVYACLFVPELRLGGTLRLAGIELESAISALGSRLPERLRGQLELHDISAALGAGSNLPGSLALEGLAGQLRFSAAPGPGVRGEGQLRIRRARVPGGKLDRLNLATALTAKTNGLDPETVAGQLELALGNLELRDRALGTVRTAVELEANAEASLRTGDIQLPSMRLKLGRRIELRAGARLEAFGERALAATLTLEPTRIATLLALAPGLRDSLPIARLDGQISFHAALRGRRPAPSTPLLELPLALDSRLRLSDVSLDGAAATGESAGGLALRARGVAADVRLAGHPKHLELKAELRAGELGDSASELRARGVEVPLSITLRPRQLAGTIGLALPSLRSKQGELMLTQRRTKLEGTFALEVPLADMLRGAPSSAVGQAHLALGGHVGAVRASQPSGRIELDALDAALELTHDPKRPAPLSWTFSGAVSHLRERSLGARLQGLRLALRGELTGLSLRLPTPELFADDAAGSTSLSVGLDRLSYPAALYRDVVGTALKVGLRLSPGGPLELNPLRLRVPGYGLRLNASARLFEPWRDLLSRALPAFEARLGLALDTPRTDASRKARALARGLRSAGKIGLNLGLRNVGRKQIAIDGRLVADHFYLFQQGLPVAVAGDASAAATRFRRSRLVLRDLNADVPLRQHVTVELDPLKLSLPPPARSILQERTLGTTYSLVRPYAQRRASLTLAGVRLSDDLLDGAGAARRVVSKSELSLGPAVLDLAYDESTLRIDQLYVKLFDGDIVGRLQLQVPRLEPPDLRLVTDLQLTDVDLAHLDPAARRGAGRTKISALAQLKYELSKRHAAGRVLLTDLSLETLDKLLVYLDPHQIDESVQANRRLLNAWYTRAVNPRVERVSIWVDHSQLNMDIRLGALWPFGAILRRALSNVKIRRLSIRPFLPDPPGASATAPTRDRSARSNAR